MRDKWDERHGSATYGEKTIDHALTVAPPSTTQPENPSRPTSTRQRLVPFQESEESDVRLVSASDVRLEPIDWIWPGWLAAGKIHILGGAPGTGKTTIAMSLAATLTSGGRWPDGSCAAPATVAVWSGEDDKADTLVPRLVLSGADLSRVLFVDGVREGDSHRSFDPARDIEPLRRKLVEHGDVRLIIVDPIVSAISGDSHKNAEVRRGLQPLADLAQSMDCAVLGITHFSKGTGGRDPVERINGSLAFGALARVVMVAAKGQQEESGAVPRLFCRAKSNIGPDDGGFAYDLRQAELESHPGIVTSCVLWGEAQQGAARDLLAIADDTDNDGGGTMREAMRFIEDMLRDGPVPSSHVKKESAGAGFSWSTVRRAAQKIPVEARKEGMRGPWTWRLPGHIPQTVSGSGPKTLKNPEDAQEKRGSTFAEIEHLREKPVDPTTEDWEVI